MFKYTLTILKLLWIVAALAQEEGDGSQDGAAGQDMAPTPSNAGGATRLVGDELKEAERLLVTSLNKFAAGYGPFYKVSEIYYVTSQPTTGKLFKYTTDLIDSNSSRKKCEVNIWTRPEGENGVEVNFHCDGNIIAHA